MTGIEAFFQIVIARLKTSLTVVITINYPTNTSKLKEQKA